MTAVLAFLFMMITVAAMSVGVMFGRKPISGSCGGMKALGMNVQCEVCGGDPNACDSNGSPGGKSRPSAAEAAALGADATRKSGKKGTRSL